MKFYISIPSLFRKKISRLRIDILRKDFLKITADIQNSDLYILQRDQHNKSPYKVITIVLTIFPVLVQLTT